MPGPSSLVAAAITIVLLLQTASRGAPCRAKCCHSPLPTQAPRAQELNNQAGYP